MGLTLSGGGFRATLFHLGVVSYLRDAGLLSRVQFIGAVSGGSVLAAHLVLNWERYLTERAGKNDDGEHGYTDVEQELLSFVKSDVRGRVVRAWLLGLGARGLASWLPPVYVMLLEWVMRTLRVSDDWVAPLRITSRLQAEYTRLYRVPVEPGSKRTRPARLQDLASWAGNGEGRSIALYATSLSSGHPCWFDTAKFHWCDDKTDHAAPAERLPLSFAVAASSAFPPMFSPCMVSAKVLGCSANDYDRVDYLTDGGVYDNLGVDQLLRPRDLASSPRTFIVSDAGAMFERSRDATYTGPFGRNVRANEVIMRRAAALLDDRLEAEGKRVVRIQIGRGDTAIHRAVAALRTDLDTFSDAEIKGLIYCGRALAQRSVEESELRHCAQPVPCRKPPSDEELEVINKGSKPKLWRWTFSDRALWGILIVVLLLAGAAAVGIFEAAKQYVTNRDQRRYLAADTWISESASSADELSGVAALPHPGPSRWRRFLGVNVPLMFVGVDDDESDLFFLQLLEPTGSGDLGRGDLRSFGVRARRDLRNNGQRLDVKDLEEISADSENGRRFAAITSHRQYDPDAKEVTFEAERLLIRFTLVEEWSLSNSPLEVQIHKGDLAGKWLGALKDMTTLSLEDWKKSKQSKHPDHDYAFEIEGLAYKGETVTLGLKWPLTKDGHALLADYDLETGRFDVEAQALGGWGISALAWDGDDLLIAANPAFTARRGECAPDRWGQSAIYVLRGGLRRGATAEKVADVSEECARLEGLAVFSDEVILAYEVTADRRPVVRRLPLSKFAKAVTAR